VFSTASSVKISAFKFYLQSGKQEKVSWMGDASHLTFGHKLPGEEGSMIRCVVVMQQRLLFVAKVQDEVFAHFQALTVKRHGNMQN
jgi:hypothetical protein